jgi:hypothetical protein
LQKKLANANTPQEKNSLERQIAANDTQINSLVYDSYGLTAEEIQTVEGELEMKDRRAGRGKRVPA